MTQLLLIDNYDSFTYNLLHYFAEIGAEVEVVRNDALTADEIAKKAPDGIIISPGPGTPDESGVSLDVIKTLGKTTPIFGVCLGHQAIGQIFGANVVRHPPMHGKVSPVFHDGKSVFKDLPSPFDATRYHSLVIDPATVPDCLKITAWTQDKVIMGVQHKDYPIHGVQFHPESIASAHGKDIVRNFYEMVTSKNKKQ